MNQNQNPQLNFDTDWACEPALTSADSANLSESYDLFIEGQFVPPAEGRYVQDINPATGKPLTQIAQATGPDVDAAVTAAREAFVTWSQLPGAVRGQYLFRIASALQEKVNEFALVETLDAGRPIRDTKAIDLPRVAQTFFYFAGWADKLEYAFPNNMPKPVGVIAQVIPWNFPIVMLANKIAPALACGNTVVLKPAPSTPLTALMFAKLLQEVGLPAGVVNIITGNDETGAQLVADPGIDMVAFTGSTAVGQSIITTLAATNKTYTLELGGKSANIVFDDAPIDQAVQGVANGIFYNQGQVCCAGSRLLVQESIAQTFLAKLKTRIATLTVGDPLDANSDLGAVNSKKQLDRIEHYIDLGQQEGAEVWQSSCKLPGGGFYCRPTLMLGGAQAMRIAQEEIFGPVLVVQTFRTADEAVEKANNTPYGLANGVWTDKGARMFELSRKLRSGVVWNNCYMKFDPASPFGGYKASGIGREGGLLGLGEYVKF